MGGISGPLVGWFFILPLLTGAMSGIRASILWGVIGALGFSVFWGLEVLGVKFPYGIPLEFRASFELFQFTGQLGSVTLFMVVLGREYHSSLVGMASSNAMLLSEIAQRELAEAKLLKSQNELESRVAERTHELAAQNKQLTQALDELKLSQSQLLQASKLASLGELGAGIAHELNQPLTVINGIVSLALDKPDSLPLEHANGLSIVLDEALRMEAIISNIRSFSRETSHVREPLYLAAVANKAVGLLREHFKVHGVYIEDARMDTEVVVEGDALVLQQVAINLLSNAKDALLELTHGHQKTIRLSVFKDSDAAVLLVADNGPGVPEQAQSRLFDPFFTTKDVGKGTGLGLSVTMGIVNDHGGSIEVVKSDLGGAAFEVRLPVSNVLPQSTVASSQKSAPVGTGAVNLNVLLVDDEPMVRSIVQSIIETTGARVKAVSCGADARAILRHESFDLLLTDLMMPEMTGDLLIHSLRQDGIHMPAVVMTGGRTERSVALAQKAGALACLEKPINREKLRQVFAQVAALASEASMGAEN